MSPVTSRRYSRLATLAGSIVGIACLASLPGCGDGGSGSSGGASEFTGTAYLPPGAVLPSDETVKSGEYTPLSRPLFIYVNKASLTRPEVVAFLRYYVSDEGQQLVSEVGYVPVDDMQPGRDLLEQAITEAGTAEASGELSGEVRIDGSSTVAPISGAVAEEFFKMHPAVSVSVGTSGTGGGFKSFGEGVTDISDASRAIKDSERETCEANGIQFIELRVGTDGLTVVVNKDNNWCDGMTVADLKKIWEPGSTVTKWSDVRPEWPDAEIKLFGPDTESGTFDYFTEEICGEGGLSRDDYEASTDDNVLVTGVAGDQYALGYFGYAYYLSNKNTIKAIAVAP